MPLLRNVSVVVPHFFVALLLFDGNDDVVEKRLCCYLRLTPLDVTCRGFFVLDVSFIGVWFS